jgi:hypothetical protein
MMYQAPRITDFGSIELRVHTQVLFSPNDRDTDQTEEPGPGAAPAAAGDAGGLALIGVAGSVIAAIAGRRNNQQEAGTGALEEEEEESRFE